MKKLFNFISNLFQGKKKEQYVTVKEVKNMYRDLSRKDLIRIIIRLTTENEKLKLKRVDISNLAISETGQVINKPAPTPAPPSKKTQGVIKQ